MPRQNGNDKPKRTKQAHVLLSEDELLRVDQVAEIEGCSRGDVLRAALRGRLAPLSGMRRSA